MSHLAISIGQHSDRGRKNANQDFHGAIVPAGQALRLKGVAVALADGISTSPVSHIAAETAVKSFLSDYYETSDAWTAQTCAERVIRATNSWLHAQTRAARHDGETDRGYVCTFSAAVLKARTAHLFHIGDGRILRQAGDSLEPLTEDHRIVLGGESYLGRALGAAPDVAIDYRTVSLAEGDLLVLCTDGVHEHLGAREMLALIEAAGADLDAAAKAVVEAALDRGGEDNLTIQILRVDSLPQPEPADVLEAAHTLPLPPLLEPPVEFDGYQVARRLHADQRSHVYLAIDASGERVALKLPAVDLRHDPASMRQFAMEEWVARQLSSPYLLEPAPVDRPRGYLYVATRYVEGVSLRQWMHDHPRPELETVRGVVEQLAQGLRALHRKQMVHRDLRPENVLIDAQGQVKIIDFGAVQVSGLREAAGADRDGWALLGAVQYTAPECLAGEAATWRADLFSLGVIAYEMLTGRLPYGAQAARVRNRADQRALVYASAAGGRRALPAWVDAAIRTAVHPDPARRYEALSDFITDLRTPNPKHAPRGFTPLAERDPTRFWQVVSIALGLVVLFLLMRLAG